MLAIAPISFGLDRKGLDPRRRCIVPGRLHSWAHGGRGRSAASASTSRSPGLERGAVHRGD